jgi:hypothetical protein
MMEAAFVYETSATLPVSARYKDPGAEPASIDAILLPELRRVLSPYRAAMLCNIISDSPRGKVASASKYATS